MHLARSTRIIINTRTNKRHSADQRSKRERERDFTCSSCSLAGDCSDTDLNNSRDREKNCIEKQSDGRNEDDRNNRARLRNANTKDPKVVVVVVVAAAGGGGDDGDREELCCKVEEGVEVGGDRWNWSLERIEMESKKNKVKENSLAVI